MKGISKEFQIALVAIIGIVVLYFGLQFLKGLTLFSNNNSYYVKFNNVAGVSSACPVYANGYRVGVVEDLEFDYENQGEVLVMIGLDNKLRLPKGSKAEIASDMLGNVKLELRMGPDPTDALVPGDTILGGQMHGIMDQASLLLPQVMQLMPKLDSILVNLNVMLKDPSIGNSLHHIDKITADLTVTTSHLNRLASGINEQMPQMLENANGMLANANALTGSLNDLDIATTMANVNAALRNVEQMTAKLNSNEGTLGLLMRDPQLYMNLNSTMMHADSLMLDLKQHPKRYVHFSIFGKKDK